MDHLFLPLERMEKPLRCCPLHILLPHCFTETRYGILQFCTISTPFRRLSKLPQLFTIRVLPISRFPQPTFCHSILKRCEVVASNRLVVEPSILKLIHWFYNSLFCNFVCMVSYGYVLIFCQIITFASLPLVLSIF